MIERIVAAVVDTKLLTLYREGGSTIEIPQGDPRVRGIVAQVMPVVQSGGTAEVDLTHLPNAYTDFEKKSSGMVRLFRVAKKAVASIFGNPEAGDTPEEYTAETGTYGKLPVSTQPTMAAVDEIIANSQSVTDPNFKDADTTEDHTMVAVVTDKATGAKKLVPGVESLKEQFSYFAKLGSTKGMEAFFARIAAVIDHRSHSVQDLLRFLDKGDLPIADDGSIIAYKLLYSRGDVYVDPHTRSVTQRVGSYVCVDDKLVDLNRRNECSNGLHIGRRGYMRSFHGDTMFMCKIAPEDVMVVPHGDPNKVRVRGYHIIAKLNRAAYDAIRNNQPATGDRETARLLSEAIAGKHIGKIEEVRIHGQRGSNIVITPLDKAGNPAPEPAKVEKHTALDDGANGKVDPKDVATQVTAVKQTGSRRDRAVALCTKALSGKGDASAAQELLTLKKTSKVSWDSLGIRQVDVERITELATVAPKPGKMSPAAVKKQEKTVSAITPVVEAIPEVEEIVSAPKSALLDGPAKTSGSSVRAKIVADLIEKKDDKKASVASRVQAAKDLLAFRKKAKVSWERLGRPALTDAELNDFISNPPKEPTPKAPAKAKPQPGKPQGKATAAIVDKLLSTNAPKLGPVQQAARDLFDKKNWTGLLTLKRTKKKSWSALGFTSKEEAEIKLHVGD